jgi:transcriptional regulator
MYNLPYYKEQDAEVVKQFMREHPFAFLAGSDDEHKPVTTQVPVFIDEKDSKLYLTGHIMRNTDHQKAFAYNPNVLAVFTGPNTYVSSGWYDKKEDKQQGSTWNYMSVHVKGQMRFLDEEALINILKRTTNHFENDPHSEVNFEHIPTEYIERMIKAIVAFEIEVIEMDNVFKLSQNRDEKSYNNIIQQLKKQSGGGKEIAELMEKRKGQVFK